MKLIESFQVMSSTNPVWGGRNQPNDALNGTIFIQAKLLFISLIKDCTWVRNFIVISLTRLSKIQYFARSVENGGHVFFARPRTAQEGNQLGNALRFLKQTRIA